MSKHTYGFPSGTDKLSAINTALAQAQADGYIEHPDAASTEVIESDAHRENDEFVVVVRTTGPASQ